MNNTENNTENNILQKLDNYTNPEKFKQKLNVLQQQLPSILIDFKKYYVFYNKNPEYDEYQQMFENIKSNLNKVNSELFSLSNNIETSTDDLNKLLFTLDRIIKQEKRQNRVLKRRLGIIEHKNNAASEMIDDYEEIYESGYLRNWGLCLSIIIVGFVIKNVYKNPQV
jgi:chromosome segregation ATPase